MRVMIIDDQATNRELCRMMLASIAQHIELFENGQHVVQAMEQMPILPDIILLDVMMPVKDGFTTAQEIRHAFPNHHIPILFLTVLDDQESFARCLSLGDDFILKPVEQCVLLAKVQAHFRIVQMHRQLRQQHDQLQRYQDRVQQEYAIAESIFQHLMDEMSVQIEPIYGINSISSPTTLFNGDLILVARRKHGGAYAMIADSSAHGLPAAMANIPVTRAFFSLAEQGCALSDMVTELNQRLITFLPDEMNLSAHLFEIHSNGFDVSWWGGGGPSAYIVSPSGQLVKRLVSVHPPLGERVENAFNCDIKHFKLEPGQKIFCCTRSFIEVTDAQGEPFGEYRLERLLTKKTGTPTLDNLYEAIHHFSSTEPEVNLSLLMMSFPVINAQSVPSYRESFLSPIPCKSELSFPAGLLKQATITNEVRSFLKGIIHTSHHLDFLCAILSELFSYLIEQGLLHLPISLKEEPEGFARYHQLRESALQSLSDECCATCEVIYHPQYQSIQFILSCHRQEQDFFEEAPMANNDFLFASQLCESLNYRQEDKTIHAIYRFDTPAIFPDIAHFVR
ncbi:fused response regulator/phosphatase [Vibrio cincinnatiensis]|uniref:response regulator n=1 Tax=Vibrio cincinnatiensis TaxID=675 RepID=UPI001EDF5357|nr:response regulator [Vibrio cincinnatiensis]MCG3735592.1 fused response regulator/phosphatase [Vibrio cincinnatiensis]